MNRKIKYYTYIIKDLVSKTKFLATNPYTPGPCVRYPYVNYYGNDDDCSSIFDLDESYDYYFIKYVEEQYGLKHIDHYDNTLSEVDLLWGFYGTVIRDMYSTDRTEWADNDEKYWGQYAKINLINEDTKRERLDRYYQYVVDDIIKSINFSLVDSITNIYVKVKFPFRNVQPIDFGFPGTNSVETNISFGQYITQKYGVDVTLNHNGTSEWGILWQSYISKFKPYAEEKMRELLSPYGYQ